MNSRPLREAIKIFDDRFVVGWPKLLATKEQLDAVFKIARARGKRLRKLENEHRLMRERLERLEGVK